MADLNVCLIRSPQREDMRSIPSRPGQHLFLRKQRELFTYTSLAFSEIIGRAEK
jgi:hypothetical protein